MLDRRVDILLRDTHLCTFLLLPLIVQGSLEQLGPTDGLCVSSFWANEEALFFRSLVSGLSGAEAGLTKLWTTENGCLVGLQWSQPAPGSWELAQRWHLADKSDHRPRGSLCRGPVGLGRRPQAIPCRRGPIDKGLDLQHC